jgi:hypothetical protein
MPGRVVVGLFVGMLGFYWFDWYFNPTGGPIVLKTEFKKEMQKNLERAPVVIDHNQQKATSFKSV